jgi:catechol 2,3-dioxygenase-like lactoylglutathione lyase family enzyme
LSELQFHHIALEVPHIAEAVEWYKNTLPNVQVLYQDETWAFIEVGGVKIAFVLPSQHPSHIAWRVGDAELERLAKQFGATIKTHRDRSRSFYLKAPGGFHIEIISLDESSLK